VSILTTLCEGFYTIPVGDKSYLVKSLIDKDVQADYARWHMMVVTQELADSRAMYTEEEFKAERDLVRKNHRNGQYDFKSKLGAERLATESGMMFIVGRLVQDLDPSKVKEFLVEAGSPMVDLINAIIKDSFPEMLKISAKKRQRQKKRSGTSRDGRSRNSRRRSRDWRGNRVPRTLRRRHQVRPEVRAIPKRRTCRAFWPATLGNREAHRPPS
jgi:hypothetical protein